jgi:hypothetical protein
MTKDLYMDKETIIRNIVGDTKGRISAKDATEIIRLSIETQGKTLEEANNWWASCGTTWSEQEIVSYVSEGHEEKLTIVEILSWGTVFRLESGLIVSWDY